MSVTKPIFRVFDYSKAIEFYIVWLGFRIDWEHKPDDGPFYMQVSLRNVVVKLSEHHGDASPGSHITVEDFNNLRQYHQQLIDKNYKYNRPGLEIPEWSLKSITMTVFDPFGNRITFCER